MAIVDTIINLGAHVRWLSLRGATVLCDRYIEDAILDLTLRFPDLVAADGKLRRTLVAAAAPRFARIDASTSTAVIKRFGVKSFPELLLFNASQATFRRYRGDFTAEELRALASDGAGALPEEPIRPASEEFELVQRASGAGLVSTKAMSMGVTIAALLFLLGVCVGCVCSLRLVAVVLTCGLCGRERQRKRGEKKD